MLLKQLCRAHFEVYEKYNGNFPLQEELKELAKKRNMSEEDLYYNLIGYVHDGDLVASDRFKYRKMSSIDDIKGLSSIFKLKDKKDLISVLKQLDSLSEKGMVRKVKPLDKPIDNLSRVLASYLENNEEVLLHAKDKNIYFSEYFRNLKYGKNKKSLEEVIQSKMFLSALNIVLPEFVYFKGTQPLITRKVFFVPYKLTSSQTKKIIEMAVFQGLIKKLDIPEQVFFYLINNCLKYQMLPDEEYLKIIDWSHSLGFTVKEMIEVCGISYVNHLQYFNEYKVISYLVGEGTYKILSINSKDDYQHVILTEQQIEPLLAANCLKSLSWEGGEPYVYHGGKQYLKDIYFSQNLNNTGRT